MLSFKHTSTTSVEKSDLTLQPHQKYRLTDGGEPAKGPKGQYTVYSTQTLTVPTTIEELRAMEPGSLVSIKLGDKGKVSVPQVVADYLVGRKLRANQEMQAELGGDNKGSIRNRTTSWFLKQGPERVAEFVKYLTDEKAKNAFLDKLYAENADEIDGQE